MAELRVAPTLAPAAPGPFAALDPCVHCGFCLQACPTYLATGDESDSPRGRIVLMRALERGEVAPSDPGLQQHLDACLGCRGCEPVCPAGVGYGRGLEAARAILARERGFRPLAHIEGVFTVAQGQRNIFDRVHPRQQIVLLEDETDLLVANNREIVIFKIRNQQRIKVVLT